MIVRFKKKKKKIFYRTLIIPILFIFYKVLCFSAQSSRIMAVMEVTIPVTPHTESVHPHFPSYLYTLQFRRQITSTFIFCFASDRLLPSSIYLSKRILCFWKEKKHPDRMRKNTQEVGTSDTGNSQPVPQCWPHLFFFFSSLLIIPLMPVCRSNPLAIDQKLNI